ncbi:uncharacterized protein LOC122662991 [Telopea speciosissima]|uniref:uncharacterized protein LOC122662991 n=1 Tax=Telopea speciosissima TaxID=54955 RepID=UPI001CC672DE|nr:uncharacterized protein LOC122662991 [Telopea speciosissima]
MVSCRAFPTSLKGGATSWFLRLRPRSISSFVKLYEQFITHFQSSVKQKKTTVNLLNVIQNPGESLKEYITRFTKESLEVQDLDNQTQHAALAGGIRDLDLIKDLARHETRTMKELLKRCNEFANVAEVLQARKKMIEAKPQDNKRSAPEDHQEGKRLRTERRQEKGDCQPDKTERRPKRTDRAGSPDYTPLNTTRSQILMHIQDRGLLNWPRPMLVGPEKRNPHKYYLFHKDTGHNTKCHAPISMKDFLQ